MHDDADLDLLREIERIEKLIDEGLDSGDPLPLTDEMFENWYKRIEKSANEANQRRTELPPLQ